MFLVVVAISLLPVHLFSPSSRSKRLREESMVALAIGFLLIR
jgi:hypothetical protein